MPIVDGASVLGYLFSLIPAPPDASWNDHWFPLLLFFSKCLFLAFSVDDADEKTLWYGVPVMATIMYLPSNTVTGSGLQRPFMFGATVATNLFHESQDATTIERKGLAITWRREQILKGNLEALGAEELPSLDLNTLNLLQEDLYGLLLGEKKTTDLILAPLHKDLFRESTKIKDSIMKDRNYEGVSVLGARMFLDDNRTRTKMTRLLSRIILHRYSAKYTPDNQETIHAYKDLLLYYITPQAYVSNTNSTVFLSDDQ